MTEPLRKADGRARRARLEAPAVRILMDATCLSGNLTGIGKTTYYLLREMLKSDEHEFQLYFNHSVEVAHEIMARLQLRKAQLYTGKRNYVLFTSKIVDRMLNSYTLKRMDVVHFPNYEFQDAILGGRSLVSVYDLSAEVYPQFFTPPMREFVQKRGRHAAEQAGRLLVCSESTRNDLVSYWKIPADRIDVVHLAPGLDLSRQAEVEGGLPERYILFVGTLEPRKNLERIIPAYNEFRRLGGKHSLMLVGQKGWLSDGIFKCMEDSPYKNDIVWKQYLPEEQLSTVYRKADLLMYPSLYEGFGMPILEAMTVGTPVVTTHVSSIPEVAGEAAVYVHPEKPDEMTAAMVEVLHHSERAEKMRSDGLERSKQFSWERVARETVEVYERYLKGTPSLATPS